MKKILTLFTLALLCSCSSNLVRIACIGDSITEGAGIKKQSKDSYPVVLNQLLGKNYKVLNNGRSAATLQKNGDLSYWNCNEFSNTFAFEPSIIVIKLGTNDTKPQNWDEENFEKDYQSLIDTLQTITTHPKIYLCLPVPVFQTKWGINDSTLNHGVIPVINKIAIRNKLEIIDLNTQMKDQHINFPDYIHPNEAGAKIMAGIIAEKISTR